VHDDELVSNRAQQVSIVRDQHDRSLIVLQGDRQCLAHFKIQ